MPDTHALVKDLITKLKKRKIKGSHATARQTADLLRSVMSQQRVPHTNQAASLIEAVKAVGEQLIAANPVELTVGNIVRCVLHIIREEDLSLAATAIEGSSVSAESEDDNGRMDREDRPALSAAAVAAAARSSLRAPSLYNLLEYVPESVAAPPTSSGGDSEDKTELADRNSKSRKLKHDVFEAINELIQDIDTCHE